MLSVCNLSVKKLHYCKFFYLMVGVLMLFAVNWPLYIPNISINCFLQSTPVNRLDFKPKPKPKTK